MTYAKPHVREVGGIRHDYGPSERMESKKEVHKMRETHRALPETNTAQDPALQTLQSSGEMSPSCADLLS
eukprot:713746-Rhodomonas_salina.1